MSNNGTATLVQRTLAGKLAAIMGEASNINKRGWNPHHKYAYVLSTDVYEATRELMARHGVILVQRALLDNIERTDKQTKSGTTTHVRMAWEFTWMDADTGEAIQVPWVSEAEDSQDKGTNKAATAARKYFLISQLQLPVEQPDADADAGSNADAQQSKTAEQQPDATAPYRRLAALAQKVHQEAKPLQAVVDTLSRAGIIAEELGTVGKLQDLPLPIVEAGIAHYLTLAGA